MDINTQPSQINPLNSGPMFFGSRPSKNKFIILMVVLAGGVSVAWWFLYQRISSLPVVAEPTVSVTPPAEEAEINQVEAIDVGDVDKEFQSIDNDLNSLDTTNPNLKKGVSLSPEAPGPTFTPAPLKSFTVLGSPFKFSLSEIKVKKEDIVRIVFKNTEGTHDWRMDAFNAGTRVLAAGQEETIEFIANKTGSFEYYCSVGTHRQQGMKGTLVVE